MEARPVIADVRRRGKGTDAKGRRCRLPEVKKWKSHGALDVQAPNASCLANTSWEIEISSISLSGRPWSEFSSSNELRCPQPARSLSANL